MSFYNESKNNSPRNEDIVEIIGSYSLDYLTRPRRGYPPYVSPDIVEIVGSYSLDYLTRPRRGYPPYVSPLNENRLENSTLS